MKRAIAIVGSALVMLLVGAAQVSVFAAPGELRVEVLDVGQGDSILIRSPEGKTALIDAGPTKNTVQILKDHGVESLDLVVVSHHHADHIGGMDAVLHEFKPKVYLDSGSAFTTTTYKRVLQTVEEVKAQFIHPNKDAERKISLGSVTLHVFPQPPEDEDNENNNSVGIRLEYDEFSVLLTGDSEEDERAWWTDHAGNLFKKAVVLKVAHHGSRNGTDADWLKEVDPKLAVISCGKHNRYHHPHEETMDILKNQGVQTKRTDEDGTVAIKSDGHTWELVKQSGHASARGILRGGVAVRNGESEDNERLSQISMPCDGQHQATVYQLSP